MTARISSFIAVLCLLIVLTACNLQVVDTRPPADATATAQARQAEAEAIAEIDEVEAPQQACDIKGNINGDGEQIYHMPDGQYYGRVKIDLTQGEQYFCSEEEALEAGYRKANR